MVMIFFNYLYFLFSFLRFQKETGFIPTPTSVPTLPKIVTETAPRPLLYQNLTQHLFKTFIQFTPKPITILILMICALLFFISDTNALASIPLWTGANFP